MTSRRVRKSTLMHQTGKAWIRNNGGATDGGNGPGTPSGGGGDAVDVVYDPTASGLTATDVQAAIDELASGGGSYTDENARDAIGAALVAGAGITITPNDGADTITIAGSYTDEDARDAIGSALVAGAGITITPNDGANTITVAATGGSGSVSNAWFPAFTTPVDGDFSWINQGGASVTVNANGGIHLIAPASASDSVRIRDKAAPATPYTITACFLMNLVELVFQTAGLCWREAGTGEVITVGVVKQDSIGDMTIGCLDFASPTSFTAINADVDCSDAPKPIWLRITDNGTDRIASWSADGYNFTTLFTEGRTVFLTADRVGFYANTSTSSWPASTTLLSWAQI